VLRNSPTKCVDKWNVKEKISLASWGRTKHLLRVEQGPSPRSGSLEPGFTIKDTLGGGLFASFPPQFRLTQWL
jgi:hypothetical protein